MDLEGDGVLEIVNPPDFEGFRAGDDERGWEPRKYEVYKIDGENGYKLTNLYFDFFRQFLAGPAKLQGDGFVASQPGTRYVMIIVNGDGTCRRLAAQKCA